MRLRSSKTDVESAGLDADGMATSVSQLRDELMSLSGVDIMKNANEFKSSYDILMGIGEVWDSLSDVNQANITEILFGKRQANIGSSILQNYERAQEILETSRDSAGSATRENEKYLKSVGGHLDVFKAKWESLSTSLADATGLKMLIDLGGLAASALDKLTGVFGSVTMAALPFVGALSKVGNVGKQKYALLCRTHMHRMLVA